MGEGYSPLSVGSALELGAWEHMMNRERCEGGVGMCMFSTKSIDLELAVIDHILFPVSVALPPPLPPPASLGHLPDSATALGAPAEDAGSARLINRQASKRQRYYCLNSCAGQLRSESRLRGEKELLPGPLWARGVEFQMKN